MRAIKFKAKRISDGRWVYGFGVINDNLLLVADYIDDYVECGDVLVDVNPKTIGQYTGLKDKNGQEIYEWDILHIEAVAYGRDMNAVVIWENGGFVLKWEDNYKSYIQDWVNEITKCGKVIGNIIDNPELIKDGE